jgi:peptidyl-prolyl cis-trans isomerase B (cyclophilin B)
MSSRRRSRRVPPKAYTTNAASQSDGSGAGDDAAQTIQSADRPIGTRSANRAAKRATVGVRAKPMARGGRSGGGKRSSNTGLILLAVGAVAIAAAVIAFGNPFGGPAASPSPAASAVAYGDGTCPTSQPDPLAPSDVKTVTIETDQGTIVMKIEGALAPIATGNFIALAECHFYDGVVFHRLVPGFVIQGGDPDGTGGGGPGYTIADDPLTTTYHRGTVAMARSPGPHSQGSQFFIVLSDDANAALTDPNNAQYPYAIMGEVTSGMDVVDAIAAMPNSGSSSGNAAVNPVEMLSVTVTDGPASSGAPSAVPGTTTPASAAPTASAPTATQ